MKKNIVKNWYLIEKEGRFFTISQREKDCIELLSCGFSMKMIARELTISARTVEYYIQCIKFKLGCSSKYAIIDYFRNIAWKTIDYETMLRTPSEFIKQQQIV